MTGVLPIVVLLVFLGTWGLAWRRRRSLAFGMLLGVVLVAVVAAIVRPLDAHHVPLWLPPLPFALVAIGLFCAGFLTWYWGRRNPADDAAL